MSFDTATPALPHIKSGKLKALAVTTRQAFVGLARGARDDVEKFARLVKEAKVVIE